ncbi:MAG TPA: tetratricopeptide repeat protein [Bryobacteraceae bacterium]|nr:tetratricopeptide repeat protein [Bryobacteraceae bacterium]
MPIEKAIKKRLLLTLGVAILSGCGRSPETYVKRADDFYKNGKFVDAEISYKKALQKAPSLGFAHYRLGLTELKLNNPAEAYRELQTAYDLMPGDADTTAKIGELALSLYLADPKHPQQLYEQAGRSASQLLARDQQNFVGNQLRGGIALIDKKPKAAVEYLRKAVRERPGDLHAKLNLAQALVEDGQVAAGIDLAKEIVQNDKTFGPAYDFLFAQYGASGKAQDAEEILKLKVSNNPTQAGFILQLARHYAATGKPLDVGATLQKLLDHPATFPDGRMLVGDFYGSAGKPEEALRYYRQGLEANAKDPVRWQKRIARMLILERKWPEALAQLNSILKGNPEDKESKLARAQVWLDEGKPENLDPAIVELKTQLANRPQDSELQFQLGSALRRKGDQDGAQREWSAAAARSPNYLAPRLTLIQLALERGNSQAALQKAEEMIAIAPRNPEARLLYATCLTSSGQLEKARAELKRLANDFPRSPQVRFRLGLLAIADKKFADAESIFRGIEASAPHDPQVTLGLAQALQGEHESEKAIRLLRDEVQRSPDALLPRQALARLALATGKYELAIEEYRKMAVAAPNSLDVQVSLAESYIGAGDVLSAISLLEKAVQSNPQSSVAALTLAQALASCGRINEAKAHFRRVLELQPDNPSALNNLAYLMATSGDDLDRALSLAQRGAQYAVEPGLKDSLSDTLGWIYLKKNMYNAALKEFQALVGKNPSNATYLYHLGATFYQMGDKQNARIQLKAAIAARPSSPDEPAIRGLLAGL